MKISQTKIKHEMKNSESQIKSPNKSLTSILDQAEEKNITSQRQYRRNGSISQEM